MTNLSNSIISKIEERANYLSDNLFVFKFSIAKDLTMSFTTEYYYKFQDDGVKGIKSGKSKSNYSFKDSMPPPSAFSKYSGDINIQFAIAKSVQQKGIEPKDITNKIIKDNIIANLYEDLLVTIIENQI